ncbi:sigma-70 family RNA polymerase sigma factor [uncultured Tenacibaculum sp.]|uniref:RNA polymerase sigma factor n=1 Tax=uncultured Tenacibaculum sp. TaxID=174713 RepID=UPI003459CD63
MTAQAQVYQLFSGKLFALCLKYSRNYQDAEDTLQDSFLTIFKMIPQYNNEGSFEGWMKRITINTALQKYREKSPLQLVSEGINEELEEEVVLETESVNVDVLLSLIQNLPDRYRLVFNLYVLDNYSHKEIASLLNITEGTSKSNLSRARQLLKKEVEVYQATAQKA